MSEHCESRITHIARIAFLCLFLSLDAGKLAAQSQTLSNPIDSLRWSTDSVGPRRFISVHGRRSAVFGYPQNSSRGYPDGGLEIWAYPVQILSSYSVAFRHAGATSLIDGQTILRRIIYSPEAVTRIYAGPDFIVCEKIFVPLDQPGAIFTYEIESEAPVDIEIRFTPVLDLMWPAAVGGQETKWNSAASAYVLRELTHRFTARIGSPDIIAHDATENTSKNSSRGPGLAFTIRPASGQKSARVIIAGGGQESDVESISKKLQMDSAILEREAIDHYSSVIGRALQIETPDAKVNRALSFSEIALDQAWVCNPDLGCGLVAGYGPSRNARRPQYDWFFAGDGMVAIGGLLASGQYARARAELEFVLKYQDKKSGMIWHEMSQSAGLLDWSTYPYMFAHVDLTFQFLDVAARYFSATGDRDFLNDNWTSIQSAFDYCRSTLDPQDSLPRIPAGKEGGREQDALSDELMLSTSWVSSARAFAQLASATAHADQARQAIALSQAAKNSIRKRYWDEQRHLWITGFTRANTPLVAGDIGPGRVMDDALFSPAERESMLDQIAGSDFQTDWGTRGNGAHSKSYQPNSYSSGSVWATGTSEIATAFWLAHRPATAFPVWQALVDWNAFDSFGHMHEAMAGDYYHEEVESVPEQTWSSSSFFSSAVHGLLGLEIDATAKRLTLAPHLPPTWNSITIRNVRVGSSQIAAIIAFSATELLLEMQNDGDSVETVFRPEIPLGAKLESAKLESPKLHSAKIGSKAVAATLEQNAQDTHANVKFTLPTGKTLLKLEYSGGVAIMQNNSLALVGEPSKALKITGARLSGRVYTVDFDYRPSEVNSFDLRTPWQIQDVRGATFVSSSRDLYRFSLGAPAEDKSRNEYKHGQVTITFAPIADGFRSAP
jgi:glycogen debranching enzyme